jgi:hypothetical protein
MSVQRAFIDRSRPLASVARAVRAVDPARYVTAYAQRLRISDVKSLVRSVTIEQIVRIGSDAATLKNGTLAIEYILLSQRASQVAHLLRGDASRAGQRCRDCLLIKCRVLSSTGEPSRRCAIPRSSLFRSKAAKDAHQRTRLGKAPSAAAHYSLRCGAD